MDRNDDTKDGIRLDALLADSRQLRARADAARRGLAQVVERLERTRAVAGKLRAEMAAKRERQAADPTLSDPRAATLAPSTVTLLYVSRLAPGLNPATVATIARVARIRNRQDGVTGLLAFDGSSFTQLLEGPAHALVDLERRLRRDRRHVDMDVLSYAPSPSGVRRFPDWQLGFLAVEAGDAGIERLRSARGEAALALFEAVLPSLDTGVSAALPA